tara:strand:+ start:48907 stop:49080 length:174 start_codon:yes stop_codon:yes gene_type:complete
MSIADPKNARNSAAKRPIDAKRSASSLTKTTAGGIRDEEKLTAMYGTKEAKSKVSAY